MYICICVYMYACVYLYINICIYIHLQIFSVEILLSEIMCTCKCVYIDLQQSQLWRKTFLFDTTQARTHHLVLPPIPFLKRENERERERERVGEKERERER